MIGPTLCIVGGLLVVYFLGKGRGHEQGYSLGTDDAVRYLRRRASDYAARAQSSYDVSTAMDLRLAAADLEDGNTDGQIKGSFLSLET